VQLTTYNGVKKSTYLHQGQNIHTNIEMWCENSIFLVPYANSFVYNFQRKFSCGLLAMANLSSSYFFTNIKHKILFENLMYTPTCLKVGNPSPSTLFPRCPKYFFLLYSFINAKLLPIKIAVNAHNFSMFNK